MAAMKHPELPHELRFAVASWRPKDNDVRWVYNDRWEVWADTKEKALRTLRGHGFLITDPNLLVLSPTPHTIPVLHTNEMKKDK